MKKLLSSDKGLTWFWILGCVLLLASHVRCWEWNDECPGGREAHLERGVLETFLSWMPEDLRNPDDICASHIGEGSTLCRGAYSNYSDICRVVLCKNPVLNICVPVRSNDGIQCGDQKWCYNGRCRYSKHAVSVQESCLFGDNRGYTKNGLSCQQLVPGDRKSCYNADTQQMCCGSCEAHASLNQGGCQYGDRVDGCQGNLCSFMTDAELTSCCQTCGYYTQIVPTRRPDVTVSPLISVEVRTLTPKETPSTTKSGGNIEITTKKLPDPPTTKSSGNTGTAATTTTPSVGTSSPTPAPTTTSSGSQTTTTKAPVTTQTTQPETTPTEKSPETTSQTETTTTQSETTTPNPTTTTTATITTETSPTTTTTTTTTPETTSTAQENTPQPQSQEDVSSAVAIGTGVAVGTLAMVVTVVTVTYVVRKRMSTPSPPNNADNASVGGDSCEGLTTGMMGTSSRWYPGYASTHPMG